MAEAVHSPARFELDKTVSPALSAFLIALSSVRNTIYNFRGAASRLARKTKERERNREREREKEATRDTRIPLRDRCNFDGFNKQWNKLWQLQTLATFLIK